MLILSSTKALVDYLKRYMKALFSKTQKYFMASVLHTDIIKLE